MPIKITVQKAEVSAEPNNILSTFETKSTLNEEMWASEDKLDPEISKKLTQIAKDFLAKLGLETSVWGLILTGSLANYNWSRFSDIDLHIVIPFNELDENYDLVREFFNAKQTNWNKKHDIYIKGHEVEIYVQDENETHFSTGVYSITEDRWLTKPEKMTAQVDKPAVRAKADSLMRQVEDLEEMYSQQQYEEAFKHAEHLKEKIKRMRKCGLEKGGIFSVENITFKVLRRNGYLERLFELLGSSYDKIMTLTEGDKMTKGAAVILIDENNRTLILKRAKESSWMPGKWGLPGGQLEEGETPKQAAIRETAEETNINVDPKDLKELEVSHDVPVYTTRSWSGKVKIDFEHDDFKWVDVAGMDKYETTPGLRYLFEEALKNV